MNGMKKILIEISILNKLFLCFLLIFTLLLLSINVDAGEVPNFNKIISMTAREQSVDKFLKELFGQIDIPVVINKELSGNVNGDFREKKAKEVFADISHSFGVIVYYDGAVAHIYTANDLSQVVMPVKEVVANRVIRSAENELWLTDKKNRIKKAKYGGVIVTGTRRFIEQIENLVFTTSNSIKTQEPTITTKVFYLKYAWAQDVTLSFSGRNVVIPGVATALKSVIEDAPVDTGYMGNQTTLSKLTNPGLRGKGLSSVGAEGRIGLDVADVKHSETKSTQKGLARITVDARLNAIIVRDTPERMDSYASLIRSLDVEAQMLEIEATIIDVNTDRMRELGINWRGIRGNDQVVFGSGGTSNLALTPNQSGPPLEQGLLASFVTGNSLQFIARINALEEEGAARIVSSPHVLTLSNVEAVFNTSSTFHVRVAGREEVDLFNVSVGTSLRVTPHVFKEGDNTKIKLLVTIEDGQQKQQVIDDIPVIERSVISTQALIESGESMLIGGLVREATIDKESRVPVISRIPILGNLFKSNTKRVERIERMFLISPRLAAKGGQIKTANENISTTVFSDKKNTVAIVDKSNSLKQKNQVENTIKDPLDMYYNDDKDLRN